MIITPKTIDKACSDLAFWLKRWSRYPLGYAIECCGIVPTYQQAEILKRDSEIPFRRGPERARHRQIEADRDSGELVHGYAEKAGALLPYSDHRRGV